MGTFTCHLASLFLDRETEAHRDKETYLRLPKQVFA